jgi:hypothetical protein
VTRLSSRPNQHGGVGTGAAMTGPTFEGLGRGREKWMSGMASFVYRCPANGQKAQRWIADGPTDLDDDHE